MIRTLKMVNRRLGNPARALGGAREAIEPRVRMMMFERDRRARSSKYADVGIDFRPNPDVVQQIERDGYAVVRNAMSREILTEIRREMEAHLDSGTSLLRISKDSARARGDRAAPTVYLTPDEQRLGQEYFRKHTNYVAIANPLVACPAVVEVAFHSMLADMAQTYLGCVPAIGGMNLRKSYANDIPEFDTLFFHVDPNSPKFLKFFFYLIDVDINGGPFCFVRGSHRQRFRGWSGKGRWTPEEIERVYGKDNIIYLTANVGDMIVADTNGFHRGTKVVSRDRMMLTVDYVIHEEFYGAQDRELFQLPSSVYQAMSARERALADFLKVI
ncbi:MAG: phytanoyl-CoA dioxygenase family protein [Armatimonadota bacterium]